jgi:uncharacterized protein YndB with AHSA1/START domain
MSTTIRIGTDVTDQSVKKGTGKNWQEWKKLLDKAGASQWPRKQIVALLTTKYKLSPWWRQMVTTGYEILTGKKVEGRNAKGEFSVTATKSFQINAKTLWKILASEKGLAVWLKPMSKLKLKAGQTFECEGGIYGEIRTIKPGQRIRIKWQDSEWEKPTILQVFIVPRKGEKALLAFHHEKLINGRLRNEIRAHWKQVLSDLSHLKS